MDKIGGAIIFASENEDDFYGCKAVVAKDFANLTEKAIDAGILLAISSSFAEDTTQKLESKGIKPVILDKHSIEDAYKSFADKDSEVYLIKNEDDSYKLKFFSGSLSKSYQLRK
jgi:hypothetical protein